MQTPTVVVGKIRPGRNPRKYFDPAEMAELTESVRVSPTSWVSAKRWATALPSRRHELAH